MPSVTLAKLTRPRLYGTIPRGRLFQCLDERRQHPLVWVTAPPGAGKTSLVASYITERQIPGIWYQVDSGDTDPATFFYYLGRAAGKISKGKPMPVLAPEHLPNIGGFARRFFRELFERLGEGALVVLDNFQEASSDPAWTQVIDAGAEEIPEGINLICISRTQPPPAFARHISTGRLAALEWKDLRLTLEEARQIAAVRQPISEAVLAKVHQRCDGWAAGLTLMLERAGRTEEVPEAIEAETQEAVFNYFAGTLFDRIPIENRHALLCTALLPRITPALAEKLTGNPGIGTLLEDLHRRQLFTYRRHLGGSGTRTQTGEPTYEYHALFRAFLQSKAKEEYTPEALRRLSTAAAQLLDTSGQPEAAIALYGEAGNWQAQTELILRQAPALLRQGRGQTLREWIDALPQQAIDGNPWLSYWLGVSLIPIDQSAASERLEWVFNQLALANDATGQALTAARIIEAEYRAYSSLKRFDRWIDVLDKLIARGLNFPDREVELRIYCGLLLAVFARNPRHPRLKSSVERLCQIMTQDPGPDQILTAGDVLLRYFDYAGDSQRANWVIGLVETILENPAVMPLSRLYWWGRVADFYIRQARYAQAGEALAKADRLAADFAGHPAAVVLHLFHVFLGVLQGDLDSASEHCTRLHMATTHTPELLSAVCGASQFFVSAWTGTLESAIGHNRTTLKKFRETGMFFGAMNMQIGFAALLAPRAPPEELIALISQVKEELRDTYMQHHETELLLIEAYVALREGRRDHAVTLIEVALAIRPESDLFRLRMVPRVLPAILAFALREGAGQGRVGEWITQYGIRGGPDAPEQWPWPLKIRTLGTFALARNGEPLSFKGKLPRKPLELLKLLVCGGVEGLPARAIADKLWPDLEADAALNNVDTNVHRLRKVLGIEAAIKSSEGRVAIDAWQCWVDAWAFERAATHSEAEAKIAFSRTPALELYRGHFLDEEGEQPWAVAYRTKLRTRMVAFVQSAGAAFQRNGDTQAAVKLYERALALDNLAEPLYRQLMHCRREQGESAEALKVYRRCKEMLSIVLGMEPSKETQALAATLRDY
ncbi:MAG: BTAD domain-containing putative transcriptional regulator [Burkholderiales bacterium]